MTTRLTITITFLAILMSASAQVSFGGTSVDNSAMLDMKNAKAGVLLPRLTQIQIDDASNPAYGLIVFNTTLNCLYFNYGTRESPDWNCVESLSEKGLQYAYWKDSEADVEPNVDNLRDTSAGSPYGKPTKTGFIKTDFNAATIINVSDPDETGFVMNFKGIFQVQNTGNFEMIALSNDGTRIYIDGVLVLDNWREGPTPGDPRIADIDLAAGKHDIEFLYYYNSGGYEMDFSWGTNPDGLSGPMLATDFLIE